MNINILVAYSFFATFDWFKQFDQDNIFVPMKEHKSLFIDHLYGERHLYKELLEELEVGYEDDIYEIQAYFNLYYETL